MVRYFLVAVLIFIFCSACGVIKYSVNGTVPPFFACNDYFNNRVLIWNSHLQTLGQAPEIVLGQPNLYSSTLNYGGVGAHSFSGPAGIFSDGTHFIVVDSGNNRILIWNSLPTRSLQAADIVLGQPDFISVAANAGGARGANTLSGPSHAVSDGKRLLVVDNVNNRILIWNTFPTANQQAADLVLGQGNFSTAFFGTSSQLFKDTSAVSVAYDGQHIFLADIQNNRVLIWNTFPTVNQQPADIVLGQPSMTSFGTGTSSQTMNQPYGVFTNGRQLFVAERINNRILIWNSIPTVSQQPADVVVGQPDMNSGGANTGGISAATLNWPGGINVDDKLIVADRTNNRILIWNSIPTSNGMPADIVLGQTSFTSGIASLGPQALNLPSQVFRNGSWIGVSKSNGY